MGRILPALGTNQIAGFVEYRPLTNWEKIIKVTSHLQKPKNPFFFYLSKLNINIQSNVSINKFSEIFKSTRVNKSGRGHNLGPGRIPSFFHVISIFSLQRALSTIHTWKLFAYGKIFAHGKIKSGKKSLVKKLKKKTDPKKKERVPFCQKKEKNFLFENDWYWRSSTLAPRFRKRRRHQTKIQT